MSMLSCLDPVETLIGVLSKRFSVTGASRISPSNITTILPFLGGFGSGDGHFRKIPVKIPVKLSPVKLDHPEIRKFQRVLLGKN